MKENALTKPILRSRDKSLSADKEVNESMLGYGSPGDYLPAIINSLEDELMVIDRDYRIIEANEAVLLKHSKRRQEVIGKYCYNISHGQRRPCRLPHHECPLSTVWETGQPTRVTHCHVYQIKGEKRERYLDIIASPIKDSQGNVIAVTEVMRDVTEAKEMEWKTVAVRVRDDGEGFDVEEAISSKDRPRGLGLLGMKERVEFMNGTWSIRSRPGSGTEVDIEIPINYEASSV